MDTTRRQILSAGVAAAAAAAVPRLFAQQGAPGKFYERGPVRIYYEEAGSGFPLLLLPGGGLNATIGFWSMCRALSVELRDQKYSDAPSLTYRNVAACGTPVGDAVASVSVLCSFRYSRTGPGSSCSVVLIQKISLSEFGLAILRVWSRISQPSAPGALT